MQERDKVCSHVIVAKLLIGFRLNLAVTDLHYELSDEFSFYVGYQVFRGGHCSVLGLNPFPKIKKAAGNLQEQKSCPLEATVPPCNPNAIGISASHIPACLPISHRALKRAILGTLNSY